MDVGGWVVGMIIGVGIDLAEVGRIRDVMLRRGDRFMARVYSQAEREYCLGKADPASHFAARFAAKEAFAKAVGTGVAGGMRFSDIEVVRDAAGRPTLELSGHARELAASMAVGTIHLSLTHTRHTAGAVVVLEG